MNYLTQIGKDILTQYYYLSECEILARANRVELGIKINFVYNQIHRLETRINEMILAIPEWNEMK